MSVERSLNPPQTEVPESDPALERLQRGRLPGEVETGMMSGADDAEISATDRFAGEVSEDEALEVLDPEHTSRAEKARV